MIHNFLFHRVHPKRDPLWDPMDVSLFDKCVKYITNNYEVVLLEDFVLSGGYLEKGKKKIATIVFDDGYKDNIEYAAPILKKYNCKASFYVVTDCIDTNTPTWTHNLEYAFLNTQKNKLILDYSFMPTEMRHKTFSSSNERISVSKIIKPFLKTLTSSNRQVVLEQISSQFNDVDTPKLMMSWNDIKQLRTEGHYIGSHTCTHNMLGTISDENDIKRELLVSAQKIEQQLGYFPSTISYPIGSYNEKTIQLSKEVGYLIGLAVKQRPFNPQSDGIFEIPRIELYNEPWPKTWLRITNTLERIKKTIRYR